MTQLVALATPSVSKRVLVILGVIADPAGRALTGLHALGENETKKGHEPMLGHQLKRQSIDSRRLSVCLSLCCSEASYPFFQGTHVTIRLG